ncbi:MAG: FIST N-terminal domain-containing protein, partial [Actinomycetes bacterium]
QLVATYAPSARAGPGGAQADLAAVFVAGPDEHQAGAALRAASPGSGSRVTIGVRVAGVWSNGRWSGELPAAAVWLTRMPHLRLRSFHLEVIRTSEAVAILGMPELPEPPGRCGLGLLVLADPLSFPTAGFLAGLPSGLDVSGALASGGTIAGSSRLLLDDRVVTRGAVGLLLGPTPGLAAALSVAIAQGVRPVGPPLVVTGSTRCTIGSLAGMGALTRLSALLADLPPVEQALASAGVLAGVAVDESSIEPGCGDYLVSAAVGADPHRDRLVLADPVPVGCSLRCPSPGLRRR